MNYFFDTEFIEGLNKNAKKLFFWGRETKPTIDLISIGIVAEDGRKYYAICKDFNLTEAWNRFEEIEETQHPDTEIYIGERTFKKRVYWLRENVLKPIYEWYLREKQSMYEKTYHWELTDTFSYGTMKRILRWVGKTKKQIAQEILDFVGASDHNPRFHAWYADYDWVAFCWLFGRMIDLPKKFPFYCVDVKQHYDFLNNLYQTQIIPQAKAFGKPYYESLRDFPKYPQNKNEHDALSDAIYCKEIYDFLQQIQIQIQ